MIGRKHIDEKLSFSESSSSGTGETSRRSDSRSRFVVEALNPKVRLGLRFERKGVALRVSAMSPAERVETHVDPSSLLNMNLDMGLSGPTSSTADFTHSVNLTSSSLISVWNHFLLMLRRTSSSLVYSAL